MSRGPGTAADGPPSTCPNQNSPFRPRKRIVPSCPWARISEARSESTSASARPTRTRPGKRLQRRRTLGARRAHAHELPRALRGAGGPDRRHRVSETAIGQQGRVAQVRGGGEHVELEPDRRAGAEAEAGERRLEPAQARQGLDIVERALGAGTLEIAPDEQERVAGDGNDQLRVLRRAGQVVEVGRLDEQRRVETRGLEPGPESRETRFELRARRGLQDGIGGHGPRS